MGRSAGKISRYSLTVADIKKYPPPPTLVECIRDFLNGTDEIQLQARSELRAVLDNNIRKYAGGWHNTFNDIGIETKDIIGSYWEHLLSGKSPLKKWQAYDRQPRRSLWAYIRRNVRYFFLTIKRKEERKLSTVSLVGSGEDLDLQDQRLGDAMRRGGVGDRSAGTSRVIQSISGSGDRRPSPEEILIRREIQRTVQGVLNSLPPGDREAIRRIYFEDQPIIEYADELGIKRSTLDVKLTRAKAKLKAALIKGCRIDGLLSPHR